jgi:hypothetical protein
VAPKTAQAESGPGTTILLAKPAARIHTPAATKAHATAELMTAARRPVITIAVQVIVTAAQGTVTENALTMNAVTGADHARPEPPRSLAHRDTVEAMTRRGAIPDALHLHLGVLMNMTQADTTLTTGAMTTTL